MDFQRSWHKSYAPDVPKELDFEKITLPEVLTRTAGGFPDRTALIFMEKKILYRELESLVNRFARALTQIGVKPGDTVAMILPNMPQTVIADYAAMRIGAVAAMYDPLSKESDLIAQINDSDSRVLVALDLLYPRVMDLKAKTGIENIIFCHISDYLPFPSNKLLPWLSRTLHWKIGREKGVYEFLPLLGGHPDTPVENAARWEDVAALLYTGGKTGASKGVMLTHANLSCNVQQLRAWAPDLHDGRESVLAVFPFFRAAGWTGIQNLCIFAGWTDILVPKPEPNVVLEIMGKCRPTILPGAPAIYAGLLAHKKFRGTSLSSVKGLIVGAAPLPVEVVTKIKAVKDGPVINLYGLTELSPVGTAIPWGGTEKPGTVGVPLPGTDLKIVDAETGTRELPAGEAGEICFKGPQVMKGYHKKPRETEAVLRNGWLYTGDIGFLDEDGYLTLVDKK
ncbi:MAG: AMP-binding protein [Proteobacteria bacterium]|nr:AMP-binding protein [Pseudomonadota bacterium]MBU2226065.1 AMP-binding protein [Pseudomonadota bacterium]MBU2260564.1 AMP-binding protein [Pseudomonadota bacterium]